MHIYKNVGKKISLKKPSNQIREHKPLTPPFINPRYASGRVFDYLTRASFDNVNDNPCPSLAKREILSLEVILFQEIAILPHLFSKTAFKFFLKIAFFKEVIAYSTGLQEDIKTYFVTSFFQNAIFVKFSKFL